MAKNPKARWGYDGALKDTITFTNLDTKVEIEKQDGPTAPIYTTRGVTYDEFSEAARATEPDGNAEGKLAILKISPVEKFLVIDAKGNSKGMFDSLDEATRKMNFLAKMTRKLKPEEIERRRQDWAKRHENRQGLEDRFHDEKRAKIEREKQAKIERERRISSELNHLGYGEW